MEPGPAGLVPGSLFPVPAPLYFAAENLRLIEALYPDATIDPSISPPEDALARIEDGDDARRRLLRGWTEALGPIVPVDLADRLGLETSDVEYGLRQLEGAGFVLSGKFTPGEATSNKQQVTSGSDAQSSDLVTGYLLPVTEYCDRRLLARIHRYTLDRLRREIDPVSAQDYVRFLLRWQHLAPDSRLAGKAGVRTAIARLQGYEAAASAWERELLAARVSDYRSSWLDELCLAGEVVWARLTPGKSAKGGATPTRATPLTIALRRDFSTLILAVRRESDAQSAPKTGAASEIRTLLQQRGALFFDEIVNATRRLRSDVERGLRELVARGLVTADGFQGLRQLLGRVPHSGRSRSQGSSYSADGFFAGSGPAGRWSLVHTEPSSGPPSPRAERGLEPVLSLSKEGEVSLAWSRDNDDLAEAAANVLLQRYGVLFRDLYPRESLTLPWRDVLRALRRLEARGLVRGGRFVSGFNGEQYALPDAVDALRRVRRQEKSGERVWVSAADPANLSGEIVPGPRLPGVPGRALLYIDGLPQADEEPPLRAPVPSRLAPRLGLPARA